MVDLKLNRSIYLARRDKFYLLAVNHLCEDFLVYPIDKLCVYISSILNLLKVTKKQAVYSMRGKNIDIDETFFLKSLELLIEELQAAKVIIKHNRIIQEKNSFLNRFVGEIILPESEVEFSKDIVAGIIANIRSVIFRLTDRFEDLRKKCFALLSEEEKMRYNMMFDHDEGIKEFK